MAIDWFNTGNNSGTDTASLMRALGGEVRKYTLMDKAADFAMSKLSGSGSLDNEARKLDILLKKKQLGMDIDDDEYQDLLNHKKIAQAGAASLMNSIPKHAILRAHFKTAHYVPEPSEAGLVPFFKTAYAYGNDDLPNIMGTFKGGIKDVARKSEPGFVRGLTRFIGRR
jgi:hypothetical protein